MKLFEWQEMMRKATGARAEPIYWACLECGVDGVGKMPGEHKHKTYPLGFVKRIDKDKGTVTVSAS